MPNTTSTDDGCQLNPADTSWVLVSFVLVLLMMPALALFQAGLLRSKNTLSIISQVFSGLMIGSVLWNVVGFSLVFGKDTHGIIGSLEHAFMIGVSSWRCNPHAKTIPAAAFALFQMMFASITPVLITGAIAERMQFRGFIVLCIFWEILVYYPLAHWVWGGGFLQTFGVKDFAGGIVIHTSAGVSSLVCCYLLGPRQGFKEAHGHFPPSNVPLAALGTGLLWIGWFGFNAGSALTLQDAQGTAVTAMLSTQIGSCSAAFVWLVLSWIQSGKPGTISIMNGVISGMAGITPAAGYIHPESSLVLGLILGASSFLGCLLLHKTLVIDDALEVSVIHGLTGLIGSISIGFLADQRWNDEIANGIVYGGSPRLLGVQICGVLVASVYPALITFLIIKVLGRMGWLRATPEGELHGLDLVEHGEIAYHDLALDDPHTDLPTEVLEKHVPQSHRRIDERKRSIQDMRARTSQSNLNAGRTGHLRVPLINPSQGSSDAGVSDDGDQEDAMGNVNMNEAVTSSLIDGQADP